MKYHKHIIVKVSEDLGEEDSRLNFIYKIYDNKGEYIINALTLQTAKNYIDSGYNQIYL